MSKSKIKTVIWIIGILALAGGGLAWWRGRQAEQSKKVSFQTVKINRGNVVGKVTATGTLSALITVQVGSQVSGRLKDIFVDYNSPVTKGQVLAKIDQQMFLAALEQSRANAVAAQGNYTKAQVQAADAERQFQRSKALAERKLIAQADLDTAQANWDSAKAQVSAVQGSVEQARAALHQNEINLTYTTIYSPINGVVISRSVDVGQTVAASLQAPTLFVIAEDLRKMQVHTSVAEADVGRLSQDMAAYFTVDAYPSDRFVGTVAQIRNAAQTVQNIVTYDAVINVANPDLKLRPGMTANVNFIYADRNGVLTVSNAALRYKPSTEVFSKLGMVESATPARGAINETRDQKTVWRLRGKKPESVKIRTGVTDGSLTEIVEGDIREGDQVITDTNGTTDSSGAPKGGAAPVRMRF
jgi:HlyD family secretion protein